MSAYPSVARRAFAAATITLLAALFGATSAGTSAAARPAVSEDSLYETVSAAILQRAHVGRAQATAAGRHTRVDVQRQ
ncbi:hypothetical protein, partial [Dactylosporangium fulvum]